MKESILDERRIGLHHSLRRGALRGACSVVMMPEVHGARTVGGGEGAGREEKVTAEGQDVAGGNCRWTGGVLHGKTGLVHL